MANRRSESSRTTRTPRTPASASTSAQTPASVPAPTYATTPAPSHTAGSAPAQTPAKTPAKKSTKSMKAAPRRARKAQTDPPARSTAVSGDQRRAMIAEAAYFHAEQRGFMPGGEQEDWLVAETEVDALLKTVSGRPQ